MEPGTALAVLAMIKPTAKVILELWQDTTHFGPDIRAWSIRFSQSNAHLDHYQNILFTQDKFPGISGTLYDALPKNERLIIFDMLGELRLLLETYLAASKRYALDSRRSNDNADLARDQHERDAVLIATANAKDEEHAKAIGWMKKAWWAMW